MLGYDNLMNHYKTNFSLMQHHKYSLSDLEKMIPWERYIYISLLKQYLEEQEQKMKDAEAAAKASHKIKRK
jgi:hypothetical protein